MVAIEYIDHLPDDWFVFEVMRKSARKWDWVAILVDTDPDDELRIRSATHRCFRIPGKHRNRDAAWDTLEDLVATRH